MAKDLTFDNIKVEFLYPFKIEGWRTLRQYIINYLDDKDQLSAFDGATVTSSFVDAMSANPLSCNISSNLRFMEMLSHNINRLKRDHDGLLWATCHSHERRGTRPYCIKDEPFMILCMEGQDLTLLNPERLPDLRNSLPKSMLRCRATVKLLYSGFGILVLKFHLMTLSALQEAVSDIIHGSVDQSAQVRENLERALALEMAGAVKYKDFSGIPEKLLGFDLAPREAKELQSRLFRLVEETTLVDEPLSVGAVVDIQNLDRGPDWGMEPHFGWSDSQTTGTDKMYHYFLSLLERDVINRVKEAVASNGAYPERIELTANLRHSSDWHASEGEFPYVLTTLTAPHSWRLENSAGLKETAEHMRDRLTNDRSEIARLLMKSKWQSVRSDWEPIRDALNNVFYSDLLYMAVHLRGALCIYYLPVDPKVEYARAPELRGSSKYREEFKITLCDQRVLWYVYTMQNQLISRDMTDISKHYEELRGHSREENFPEIFDGLSHIVTTIEDRKSALAEVMEDPLSRRGGSSLFAEMIDSSSRAFRLHELYDGLKHKLERLDMLGIHVSEGINEISNLIVSESSRGAQTTLEILESLIVGVYAADLTKFAAESYETVHHKFPFPLEEWWSFVLVGLATFLLALPWVTLIRKFRTRIPVSEPPLQERLERVFATSGPLGLGAMIYMLMTGSLRFDPYAAFVTLVFAGGLIGSWWFFEASYERRSESINLFGNLTQYRSSKKGSPSRTGLFPPA